MLHVARLGSFAAAAELRGTTPSTVSRAVSALERELGFKLFERTTRRLALSEAGQAYLDRIAPLLDEVDAAHAAALDMATTPRGRLRVTASASFGQLALAPRMAAFRAQFPEIALDLMLTDHQLDLIGERIDVAIRHGRLDEGGLISRKLMDVDYVLVASPGYLRRAVAIETPDDLLQTALLSFNIEPFRSTWRLRRGCADVDLAIRPDVTSSNAAALRSLAIEGLGVALLADWTVRADLAAGRLERVLPAWSGAPTSAEPAIWIVYPSRSFQPRKSRAFIDFLAAAAPFAH